MRSALAGTALLVGGLAQAQTDPAITKLERALPPGWTLLSTDTELVLRHDRPTYVTGDQPEMGTSGPMITLELRYQLEPRWDAHRLAEARAANDKIAGELRALRKRYRIDELPTRHGLAEPRDAEERARLEAFRHAEGQARARMVKVPRCTLGQESLFDDDAYAQLQLEVDPPEAMREAHAVADLVKQQCGAR